MHFRMNKTYDYINLELEVVLPMEDDVMTGGGGKLNHVVLSKRLSIILDASE